jgi:hypothetical protein
MNVTRETPRNFTPRNFTPRDAQRPLLPRRAAATAPCRTLRLNALIREVALHGTALGLAVASRAVLHRRCLLTSAQPSFR